MEKWKVMHVRLRCSVHPCGSYVFVKLTNDIRAFNRELHRHHWVLDVTDARDHLTSPLCYKHAVEVFGQHRVDEVIRTHEDPKPN